MFNLKFVAESEEEQLLQVQVIVEDVKDWQTQQLEDCRRVADILPVDSSMVTSVEV